MKVLFCKDVGNFSSMFSTDYNGREYINVKNLVQDKCCPDGINLSKYFFSTLPFLQGVDMMHSLTDGKLLTVKLKEAKKSLDSMWIKFKSVLL